MTDEELIESLRLWNRDDAADRIEALVRERDDLEATAIQAASVAQEQRARAERLEALLREARTDLEHYVTQEYPKHAHPYFERQWNRDMELCRRIDAALKGADHE